MALRPKNPSPARERDDLPTSLCACPGGIGRDPRIPDTDPITCPLHKTQVTRSEAHEASMDYFAWSRDQIDRARAEGRSQAWVDANRATIREWFDG